jgi:PPM family protein phosphatase
MNVEGAIKIVRMTDVGLVRDHNEDVVASDLSIGLLVLADGMGGYRAGEVASEIAALTIAAEMTEAMTIKTPSFKSNPALMPESNMLLEAVARANASIYQISRDQPQCAGMGTTLVTAVFANNTLCVGHIGDSRMYRLRGNNFVQLTEDHSLLQEQINSGLVTIEQAKTSTLKNLVTRAVGIDPIVELELNEHPVEIDDLYLMCSDGLSDLVEDNAMLAILTEANGNIDSAAVELIKAANDLGGKDNISVIIAKIQKDFAYEKGWVKNLLGKVKKPK